MATRFGRFALHLVLTAIAGLSTALPLPGNSLVEEPPVVDTVRTVFVRYWLVTKNGGPEGFNHNEEVSEDVDGVHEHRLICLEPGFQPAEFDIRMGQCSKHPPRLIEFAREQIAQGVLRGERELLREGVLHRVTWTAENIYNVEIEETLAR